MTELRVGDSVTVNNKGTRSAGKITAINHAGNVDITLSDGTKCGGMEHASFGPADNHWYFHDKTEPLTEVTHDLANPDPRLDRTDRVADRDVRPNAPGVPDSHPRDSGRVPDNISDERLRDSGRSRPKT